MSPPEQTDLSLRSFGSMNKSIVLALLGLLGGALAVTLFWPKPAAGPASVLYTGVTKVSAGVRLGNGTPKFPYFDLAKLHITNVSLRAKPARELRVRIGMAEPAAMASPVAG